MTVSPEKRAELRAMLEKASKAEAARIKVRDRHNNDFSPEANAAVLKVRTEAVAAQSSLASEAVLALPGLLDEVERLREAVTPSVHTKAAYIGEFSFTVMDRDEDGEKVPRRVLVPWDTITEIMGAISARAAIAPIEGGEA